MAEPISLSESRQSYVEQLLRYRSTLATALARLTALRLHSSAHGVSGTSSSTSSSSSSATSSPGTTSSSSALEADIAGAQRDLLLVESEVRRLVRAEDGRGGRDADGAEAEADDRRLATGDVVRSSPRLPSRPSSTSSKMGFCSSDDNSPIRRVLDLQESVLHIAAFTDCTTFGALLTSCCDCAALLADGLTFEKHRRQQRKGDVQENVAEATKQTKQTKLLGLQSRTLPTRVVARALDGAVGQRFQASLLPTSAAKATAASRSEKRRGSEAVGKLGRMRRLLCELRAWDAARATLPGAKEKVVELVGSKNGKGDGSGQESPIPLVSSSDEDGEDGSSVESEEESGRMWWKVRAVKDVSTPPRTLTAAVHMAKLRYALDTRILKQSDSSSSRFASTKATKKVLKRQRSLGDTNELRLLRRCLQGIEEDRRQQLAAAAAAAGAAAAGAGALGNVGGAFQQQQQPPPPPPQPHVQHLHLQPRQQLPQEVLDYRDAKDQVRAVTAAAEWYRWGRRLSPGVDDARGSSPGGWKPTLAVEAVTWQAETLDRRTGGHVRMRLVLGLWPRHLLRLGQKGDEEEVKGDEDGDGLRAGKADRDECDDDGDGDGNTPPVRLCFEAHLKIQDTPVMVIREFGATLSYGLWETTVPTAVVRRLVEEDEEEEDADGPGDDMDLGLVLNQHNQPPNSGSGGRRLTSDEFHRMGFDAASPARGVVYNTGSHGGPLGQAMGTIEAEWPPQAVAELSTALFGRPVNRRLVARFLVCILNPGGESDGGAMRLAFEDSCLFGSTDIHDAEFEKFRSIMSDRMF